MKPIKLSNGKYRMSKQINGSRKYFYGDSPKLCRLKFEQYNGSISATPLPFLVAFNSWLTDYVSSQSIATQTQYKGLADTHIIPIIGTIRIDRIKPFNIQTVLTHAKRSDGSPLSETTLMHIRKIMHAFFEYERRLKKSIKENPCDNIGIPKVPKTRDRRAATPEELTRLWERMSGTHYFYCYQFLLITGIRPSEACGLKYSDIKKGRIIISETRTRHEVSEGKSKNANRPIEITPAMLEIINLNKAFLKSENIESEYIFPTRDGFASNSGYLTRAWGRLRQGTGINLTLYEMRHTFVSLMIDKLPLKDLQRIIGHSTRMDTSTIYAHEFEKQNNNAEIIDNTMKEYLPKHNAI
jgi:integrase